MTDSDAITLMRAYIEREEESLADWLASGRAEDYASYQHATGKINALRMMLGEVEDIEQKLLAE